MVSNLVRFWRHWSLRGLRRSDAARSSAPGSARRVELGLLTVEFLATGCALVVLGALWLQFLMRQAVFQTGSMWWEAWKLITSMLCGLVVCLIVNSWVSSWLRKRCLPRLLDWSGLAPGWLAWVLGSPETLPEPLCEVTVALLDTMSGRTIARLDLSLVVGISTHPLWSTSWRRHGVRWLGRLEARHLSCPTLGAGQEIPVIVTRALRDSDRLVRAAAIQALGRIGRASG